MKNYKKKNKMFLRLIEWALPNTPPPYFQLTIFYLLKTGCVRKSLVLLKGVLSIAAVGCGPISSQICSLKNTKHIIIIWDYKEMKACCDSMEWIALPQ